MKVYFPGKVLLLYSLSLICEAGEKASSLLTVGADHRQQRRQEKMHAALFKPETKDSKVVWCRPVAICYQHCVAQI